MADFSFLHNPISGMWVIAAPRRSKRPNEAERHVASCPFCQGGDAEKQLVYQVDEANEGSVRVVYNKFPFAPIHEVVILSPDHRRTFAEFSLQHIDLILQTYQHRYNEHAHKGQVVIFHNHGPLAGESLPHPHTQIAVVPERIRLDSPELRSVWPQDKAHSYELESFVLLAPRVSQWPDEVWIVPKIKATTFGQMTEKERRELSFLMRQLVLIFDHRYARDFPFNFYIYPGDSWYLRLIPRNKSIGGFELATNIFVNTQNPQETMAFIKEHLYEPNFEKISSEYQAEYHRSV